jgi:hypothetical protein
MIKKSYDDKTRRKHKFTACREHVPEHVGNNGSLPIDDKLEPLRAHQLHILRLVQKFLPFFHSLSSLFFRPRVGPRFGHSDPTGLLEIEEMHNYRPPADDELSSLQFTRQRWPSGASTQMQVLCPQHIPISMTSWKSRSLHCIALLTPVLNPLRIIHPQCLISTRSVPSYQLLPTLHTTLLMAFSVTTLYIFEML